MKNKKGVSKNAKGRQNKNNRNVRLGVAVVLVAGLVLIFSLYVRQSVKGNADLICRIEVPDEGCSCVLGDWDIDTRKRTCTGTGEIDKKDWYYSSTRIGCDSGYERAIASYDLGQFADQYGIHHWTSTKTICENEETAPLPVVKITPDGGSACDGKTESLQLDLRNVKNCKLYSSSDGANYVYSEEINPSDRSVSVTINPNRYFKVECEDGIIDGAPKVSDTGDWGNNPAGVQKTKQLTCISGTCNYETKEEKDVCPYTGDVTLSPDEGCEGLTEGKLCSGGKTYIETPL